MCSGHHTRPHLLRHPISPSLPSPMRCMAHHVLSTSPTCSPSCRVLSVAPRATQPSSEHDDGPSQSHETSPWLSHTPNDVSTSWTCPLAHRLPAKQPVSRPAPMPCPSDVAPCAVTCHYSVMHLHDRACTEHVPRCVHQPRHVAWTPQPRSTTPGCILASPTRVSRPGCVGRRPDGI